MIVTLTCTVQVLVSESAGVKTINVYCKRWKAGQGLGTRLLHVYRIQTYVCAVVSMCILENTLLSIKLLCSHGVMDSEYYERTNINKTENTQT